MDSSPLSSVSSARSFTAAPSAPWRTDSQPAASHVPSTVTSVYERAVRSSSQSIGTEPAEQPSPRETLQQLQQKTEVYGGQLNSEHMERPVEEKRRHETTQRRNPPSYSLASYTGERANRTYLNVAKQKSGAVFDEIV